MTALHFDTTDTALVAVMTESEAVAAEREIITTGNRLRALLVEFYERRGWAALKYGSVREWMDKVSRETFGLSRVHLLREMIAGQIETELVPMGTNIGEIPERQLRPLAPLRDDPEALRDTWDRANELAEAEGRPRTAQHVAAAVQERTAPIEPPAPVAPMAVHFSSETPEWYTPAHIVACVVDLFGHIDLDPCSNAKGDAANVPARYHYTREDNGLVQSWRVPAWADDEDDESSRVCVYMNPPYGDEIGGWVERLVRAYTTGEITEAVALLPARVDTAWFQPLYDYTLCMIRGRLRFVGADAGAPFPSVVVYLGRDDTLFRDLFASIGRVGKLQ